MLSAKVGCQWKYHALGKNVEDISREITLKLGLWIGIINAIREEGTVNSIKIG